jgi:vesicle coat complex subunit
LEKSLDYYINEVFNLLKHQNSEIRKRAVYCCVEIYVALGKNFENFLGKIPKTQQNLIKLFIKKRNI